MRRILFMALMISLFMYAQVRLSQNSFAQCIEDDTGQLDIEGVSGSSGGTVNIPIRIQNAPNQVSAFGFDLVYDTSRLQYTGNSQWVLVQNWDLKLVNEPTVGTISVTGATTSNVISAGASGNIVTLEFSCVQGESSSIGTLTNLDSEIANWTTSGGCFQCECVPTSATEINCSDGIDDDCDGLVDFDDLDDCEPCQCPGSTPCISGRVTNRVGEPLAGKTVKLRRKSPRKPREGKRQNSVTDGNGCFSFSNLIDGTYKVKVKCRGRSPRFQVVEITGGGKVNDVNFECKR